MTQPDFQNRKTCSLSACFMEEIIKILNYFGQQWVKVTNFMNGVNCVFRWQEKRFLPDCE